jgi:ribosome maturation factor RimP
MLRDQLGELLEPVVAGLGYELWELEYAPRAGGGLLRLYIDTRIDTAGSAGAITLDDCERVSRAVSETLDVADPIPGRYTLEVSSPGLDRVLRTREHFERFAGERVRLEMMQPVDGRKRFAGRLTQVGASEITLELDGGTVKLPIEDIHRARLAPEM